MSEKKEIHRLAKTAGEFNIAPSTIVAFLQKKGFDISDGNPNVKLSPEMYEALVKEYMGDKIVKEEAQKLKIGIYDKSKEEAPEPIKTTPKPTVEAPVEPKEEVVKKEEQPKEVIKPKVPGIKEVGRIDLDALEPKKRSKKSGSDSSPKTKKKKTQDKAVPNDEIISTQEPDTTELIEETKTESVVKTESKTAEKEVEQISSEQPTVEIPEEVQPDVSETDETDLTPSSVKEETAAQEKREDPVSEESKEAENIVESTPDTAESSTASEKKSEDTPDENFIETRYIKLKAPIIKGTIKLDELNTRDSGRKSGGQGGKNQQSKAETPSTGESSSKKKRKRTRIKPTPSQQSQSSQGGGKKQAATPKVEISDEDIQRQIRETMQRLEPLGKSRSSKRRREKRQTILSEQHEHELREKEASKVLKVTEFITANELASLMDVQVTQIISTCMSIGLAVSINQRLDAETISLLAEEYGFEVEFMRVEMEDELSLQFEDDEADLEPRHPIITVMGHVDHGKTSLLDYIRKSNVIAGEAGGITQHIGAYLVNLPSGRKITFLDTPGHEAFTAMRARGAKVTDLTIIVIAADDAIMPQTVEAINHAQAAGVPIVFAITKIDKPTAAPDKIREGLASMNILVEEWGGPYQCQEINAKIGTNVDLLLEKVLLEAELLELKANPNRNGIGTVLESSLDRGRGYVAKLLVQNGTVKVGDPVLAGAFHGKVKALFNERNQEVNNVGPATPVLLLGLNGAPQAGDILRVCNTEHEARVAATKRAQLDREIGLRVQKHITLDEIGRRIAIGDFKELNIIVKGDVDGSVEALADSLLKLTTPQVQVNVIHKSVGAVTENDVLLASASNAVIVAFQVRPTPGARKLAEHEQIDIRTYSIIYTAINEIKDVIAGMHSPEIKEKILCNLEVREVFKITKVGTVAGCMVLDGKLNRNNMVRLIRDGIVIYTGKLGSLKRFKDDVKEVVVGQDCGLNIENFNDVKVGDIIEGFEEYEVKVTL